jgi:transcriptional regulator with XRE-family HTH domain
MVIGMNTNFNLGNRLHELRTSKGLSQEQLALRADITTTYLGQIEHNSKNPTVYVVSKLCDAMDISLNDFFDVTISTRQFDSLTNQILAQIHDYTEIEKQSILEICKHISKIRNKK